MPILEEREDVEHTVKWWSYWYIFFMACAEIFAISDGQGYLVAHYLFEK